MSMEVGHLIQMHAFVSNVVPSLMGARLVMHGVISNVVPSLMGAMLGMTSFLGRSHAIARAVFSNLMRSTYSPVQGLGTVHRIL